MPDHQQSVNDQYGESGLCDKILDALRSGGKDIDSLTKEDLYPFDQMHGGGLTATNELASLAGIVAGMKVLDKCRVAKGRLIRRRQGCTIAQPKPVEPPPGLRRPSPGP